MCVDHCWVARGEVGCAVRWGGEVRGEGGQEGGAGHDVGGAGCIEDLGDADGGFGVLEEGVGVLWLFSWWSIMGGIGY